jgi:hypothetical protein
MPTNRLAQETSPYLRQHRDNPVDWYAWGPEAFAAATERNVPILLSVGYSACHWCHVMAHESFEDPVVAATMNANYICIKVDREERPDVDAAYMTAVQVMTGQGGWPMTTFLTPDGRPFYAGTYFPPVPMHGRQPFPQLLAAVSATWRDRRADVEEAATRLAEGVIRATEGTLAEGTLAEGELAAGDDSAHPWHESGGLAPDDRTPDPVTQLRERAERILAAAVQTLAGAEDRRFAGFGGAPKFPPSTVLEFLLRRGAKDPAAAEIAGRTLRAMAHSGMYDQLAGGFARYAVDQAWVVPHFEKMLYDNALLARVYLHWWRLTGDPTGARIAQEICDWMLAELGTPDGGLASSLDADTAGHEGLTYVWTPDELAAVLGPEDGGWAAELLGVSARGSFEKGSSTLRLTRDVWAGPERARWTEIRDKLLDARAARRQPERDGKVIVAWNGLAIAALAEVGLLQKRPELIGAAEQVADVLRGLHIVHQPEAGRPTEGQPEASRPTEGRRDGVRLHRASLRTAGRPAALSSAVGVLEDYADLADGLLALYAVTGRETWRDLAGDLLETVLGQFHDERDRFFDTAADARDPALALLGRGADPADQPCPSGTSAAVGALLTYSTLTGADRYRDAAERALARLAPVAGAAPRFFGWALAVLTAWAEGPLEATIVGDIGGEGRSELLRTALLGVAPGLVIAHSTAVAAGPSARPAVVVCRDFTCSLPTSDVATIAQAVDARILTLA